MSDLRFGQALLLGGCMTLGGCWYSSTATPKPTAVGTNSFYRPVPGSEDPDNSRVDRGGAIVQPNESQHVLAPVLTPLPKPNPPPTAIVQPTEPPAPTTRPGQTMAQYLTVGGVIVEVSGTPIYADKVLQSLTPVLAADAKQQDMETFRASASKEIINKVHDLISTEIVYAAAMQNLTSDEKERASNATQIWRDRKKTEAGGSEAVARKNAEAEGQNFDDMVQEQNRKYIVELWVEKKVLPRVDVTAEDMRRYYEQHVKEFREPAKAQFRVIRITAASQGGVDQARAKINELHDQAVHMNDEEFAKLASSINDPTLMKSGGRIGDGWVERGSFAVTSLEDALWQLQPGQVTNVVQVGDVFYIARLENRREQRDRPFEDEAVQLEIYSALSQPQIAAQRDREEARLINNAVLRPDISPNDAIALTKISQPVLDMAIQKYPEWAAK